MPWLRYARKTPAWVLKWREEHREKGSRSHDRGDSSQRQDEDQPPPPQVVETSRQEKLRKRRILHRHLTDATMLRMLSPDEDEQDQDKSANTPRERPRTREECIGGERPCPFISCRHHLFLDVSDGGLAIRLAVPDRAPWEMEESCSLDVADRGGETLEDVGRLLGVVRERARQLETHALNDFNRRFRRLTRDCE